MTKKKLVICIAVALCIIFGSLIVVADRYTAYDIDKAREIILEFGPKEIEAPIETSEVPEISEAPMENISAYISFTFDDNKPNHLNVVAPILAKYGMAATRYYITGVNPSIVEGTNFTECKVLRDQYGWEIGGHTRMHYDLTTLNETEATSQIAGCKEDLAQNGIEVKTFTPPSLATNANVAKIIKDHYSSCRDEIGINYPPYDPYHIKMISLNNRDNPQTSDMLAKIDDIKEKQGWIVFMAHRVDNTGDNFSTDEAFFRNLVRLISEDMEIRVTTISETLEIV